MNKIAYVSYFIHLHANQQEIVKIQPLVADCELIRC